MVKKYPKLIWNEFLYGGHLHSLGVISLIFVASILISSDFSWIFFIITYLGIHSVYLYNRYKEYNIDSLTNPDRTKHIKSYIQKIPIFILVSFSIILLILLNEQKLSALFFSLFLFVTGLLYTDYLKSFTKKMPGFKNFFISLYFSLLVVLLSIYNSRPFDVSIVLVFAFIFVRVFNNTIFFDLKDVESDKNLGLKTFPIIFKKNIFLFLHIINIFSLMPIVFGAASEKLPASALWLLLLIPYNYYYFKKASKKDADISFLAYFFADGEYLLWPFCIFLSKIF